jgi:hypothetical protein
MNESIGFLKYLNNPIIMLSAFGITALILIASLIYIIKDSMS